MTGNDSQNMANGHGLTRRSFVASTVAGSAAIAAAGSFGLGEMTGAVAAPSRQDIEDISRAETLILVGVGGEATNQFADPESINPFLTSGSLSRSGYQVMYEPLAMYNMLTGEELPWLATDWTYNEDFTEVTVTIREGILWSDGTPYTAEDPAFTLNMLRDAPATVGFSVDMNLWVEEASAPDPLTLVITLKQPNPRFFFQYLTHHADNGVIIVPKHIWEGEDTSTFTNYDLEAGWPVVTGPYRLVASGTQQKIWDRRDDWWGSATGTFNQPAPRRLVFTPDFDAQQKAQLIIQNEADISLNLEPQLMQVVLAQNPNVITHSGRELPYGYVDWWPTGLGFNCSQAPFDDPEIRWAISYAIDRDEVVDVAFVGAAEPTTVPFPYYEPLLSFISDIEDLLEQYPTNMFDVARTDEILTGKGYAKDDDGYYAKDGERLQVPITTFPVLGGIAPVITAQLERAGISSDFQLPSDFYSRLSTGEAPAWLFGHGGSTREPYFTLRLYHSRYVKPTGEQTYPFYRWSNAEFDEIVDRMGTLGLDDPELRELFRQAMEIWLRELPDVQITQFYHRIPMNQTYWTGWPTEENIGDSINGAFWHRTFLKALLGLQPAGGS